MEKVHSRLVIEPVGMRIQVHLSVLAASDSPSKEVGVLSNYNIK